MKEIRVKTNDNKGQYRFWNVENFEFVNPIQKIQEIVINLEMLFSKEILRNQGFPYVKGLEEEILLKNALVEWGKKYKEISSTPVPASFVQLLECKSKKEQVKILKGTSITEDELIAFIFKAYTDYGFLYSHYNVEHYHKGLDKIKLPRVIHKKENGELEVIGETPLSKGQLKQAIDHRTMIISKFLDKEDCWHCFFYTMKSLVGEEKFDESHPHMHYISNYWGFTRAFVLNQLGSKNLEFTIITSYQVSYS